MNQHGANTDLVQDADLFDQCPRERRVGEDFAAYLDNEDLALEKTNVGGRVFERGYDNCAITPGCHFLPPSI